MRFLIDENLPTDLAETARISGHLATLVRDVLPGARDALILDRLRSSREILVTRDIRFANLVLSLLAGDQYLSGVILIREQRLADIRAAWARFLLSPRRVEGIVVVTATASRYRRRIK